MQSRINDIRAAGIELVAISVDAVEDSQRLSEKLGLEFPLLSDPQARVIRNFGVLHEAGGVGGVDIARPASFLIDRDGTVVWRELTDNWRVRLRPERVLEAATHLR